MAKDLDWTDVIRNQIQLIDELLLVDLQMLETLREQATKGDEESTESAENHPGIKLE